MKRKFVKVMFFGALALSTVTYVGCKDYDDDVKGLQEQIDKINAKEPGVSTDAMNSAIQNAVASLKTQLETAISGKADNASVQALQTKVNELVTALEGKADASKITELVNQIGELSTEVNKVKGSLDETKTKLEGQITGLETQIEELKKQIGSEEGGETPEDSSMRDQLNKLTVDLAKAQSELGRIEQLTKDNAGKIIELTGQIAELNKLNGKIAALEAAHANFVQTGDLAAYYTKEEISGIIDRELASYMTSEQVASYVDEIVKTEVLMKIDAINTRLDEFDSGLSKVSNDFATYCQEQNLAYNKVIERIKALEDYKSATLTTLEETVKGQGEDLAQALLDIKDLSDKFAGYATTSALTNLETSVKAYVDAEVKKCTDSLTTLEDALEALEVDVKGLKSMIQSVTFVPEYTDGKVEFSALILQYTEGGASKEKTVAETNNAVLKFRVSPKSAAAKFADFYEGSFDVQEARTTRLAGSSIFSKISEPDLTDAADGIVKYTVTISANQSYVVCLDVKRKGKNNTEVQDEDFTNINSNYFPVVYTEKRFDKVRSVSPKANVTTIVYNDESDKIDYADGAYFEFKSGLGSWEKLSGFDLKNFSTTYTKTDASGLFKLSEGVLCLTKDAIGKTGTIGKKATVSSKVVINGVAATSYQENTSNLEVTAIEKDETVSVEFNLGDKAWADVVGGVTIPLDMLKLYNAMGYTAAGYEAVFGSTTNTQTAAGVNVAFTKTSATVTIDPTPNAGEKTCKTVISFTGTAKKLEVTVKVNIKTPTDAQYKLVEDSHFLLNGVALFNPSIPMNNAGTVVTGAIGLTKDLKELFENYVTSEGLIGGLQGKIKFEITTPVAGVKIENDASGKKTLLTYDPSIYKGGNVSIETTVTFGSVETDSHSYRVELKDAEKLSGTWKFDSTKGKKAYTIDNENKVKSIPVFNGFSWLDGRGKLMWENGSEANNTTDFSTVTPLKAYHLSTPTFSIEGDTKGYFAVDQSGKITLTADAKLINGLAQAYTITVKVAVASPWGAVTGTANNTAVTVTIPAGFTY